MKWILLGAVLLAIVAIELILRFGFGFGTPLLYVSDPDIGYLVAPNQTVWRFGNRIIINRYSMRSDPISPQPSAGTRRMLLLGDSIVAGGWWTDQADILSATHYIDFLPIFATDQPAQLYRDPIHLNQQGTQLVSESIIRSLEG